MPTDRRTGRHTYVSQLIVASRNFTNASKKNPLYITCSRCWFLAREDVCNCMLKLLPAIVQLFVQRCGSPRLFKDVTSDVSVIMVTSQGHCILSPPNSHPSFSQQVLQARAIFAAVSFLSLASTCYCHSLLLSLLFYANTASPRLLTNC